MLRNALFHFRMTIGGCPSVSESSEPPPELSLSPVPNEEEEEEEFDSDIPWKGLLRKTDSKININE